MADEATVSSIFTAVGRDGLERIVAAFYRRIPNDPILGPMYPPEDLLGAKERLGQFFCFRFGGPQDYIVNRGHPRLRMRHAPFEVNVIARDRWMELMSAAIDESDITPDVARSLREFLGETATFLVNTL